MILTSKQTQVVTNEEGVYECGLITQPFAYKLFFEQVSPLGDIVAFESPARIGPLGIEKALTFAIELPSIQSFGSICFLRLYAAQLGSLLSVITSKEYYVEDSSLFTDNNQASLTLSNQVKGHGLLNIVFPILTYSDSVSFDCLDLSEGLMSEFKNTAIESFRYLTNRIFIETRRDNF